MKKLLLMFTLLLSSCVNMGVSTSYKVYYNSHASFSRTDLEVVVYYDMVYEHNEYGRYELVSYKEKTLKMGDNNFTYVYYDRDMYVGQEKVNDVFYIYSNNTYKYVGVIK